jgi:hypothetical protein
VEAGSRSAPRRPTCGQDRYDRPLPRPDHFGHVQSSVREARAEGQRFCAHPLVRRSGILSSSLCKERCERPTRARPAAEGSARLGSLGVGMPPCSPCPHGTPGRADEHRHAEARGRRAEAPRASTRCAPRANPAVAPTVPQGFTCARTCGKGSRSTPKRAHASAIARKHGLTGVSSPVPGEISPGCEVQLLLSFDLVRSSLRVQTAGDIYPAPRFPEAPNPSESARCRELATLTADGSILEGDGF